MKKIIFKGCGTAIVTPFNENGVDFEEFKKLIEFQIKNKADSIIVCGTTGESSTMTLDERKETIEFAVNTVKRSHSRYCWNWWKLYSSSNRIYKMGRKRWS